MKILAYNLNLMNITNFKSLNSNSSKFANYDDFDDNRHFGDDCQQETRDVLRQHYLAQIMPGYNFNENGHDYEKIEDLPIKNLAKLGYGAYKGETLAHHLEYLDVLKNSNISTIIDLIGFEELKKSCQDKNIDYFKYKVDSLYWNNSIFQNQQLLLQDKKEEFEQANMPEDEKEKSLSNYREQIRDEQSLFIKNFLKLIEVMQGGFFYISCEYGSYRTPNIMALCTWFNPQWYAYKMFPTDNHIFEFMKNMYKNLTLNDKIKLGITQVYENSLKKYLLM